MKRTITEAFWANVQKGKTEDCWLWIGRRDPKGYGKLNWKGVEIAAHRLSYELHFGPLLPGFGGFHRCDMPACVNPKHLWTGTQLENLADCRAKGRQPGPPKGELAPTAKLTETQVVRLRELHRSRRLGYSRLSRLFGVCETQVRRIVARQRWKHVA